MKKLATLMIALAILAIFSVGASALQITSPVIGNNDKDRVKDVTATFTIKNNGTAPVNGTISSTADAKYGVTFNPSTFNLAAGESATITVTADIPLDHNAVESDSSSPDFLEEKAIKIGEIQAKDGSTVLASADLKMQAVNQLEIKNARLECGTKAESLDDGDEVENLKPDTQCTIEVEVENNFPEDDDNDAQGNALKIGDIEFDNVDVEIEVDDNEFDVNEDDEINSLGADDEDSVSIDFDIEEDVDDKAYTMDIFVSGRDDNGALHGEHWKIKLDVRRLTHDIQIRSLLFSPSRVSACDGGQLKASASVANMGKRDEDDVAVELDIPDLKISKRIDNIELDEDDSRSVNFVVDVPANTKAGVYRATMNTFFDGTAPSNSEALEFTVDKCEEPNETVITNTEKKEPESTTTTAQTSTTAGQATGSQTAGSGQTTNTVQPTGAVAVPRARVTSTGFTESPAYLWLLGGLVVLVLVILVAVIVVAFRRPRQNVL